MCDMAFMTRTDRNIPECHNQQGEEHKTPSILVVDAEDDFVQFCSDHAFAITCLESVGKNAYIVSKAAFTQYLVAYLAKATVNQPSGLIVDDPKSVVLKKMVELFDAIDLMELRAGANLKIGIENIVKGMLNIN